MTLAALFHPRRLLVASVLIAAGVVVFKVVDASLSTPVPAVSVPRRDAGVGREVVIRAADASGALASPEPALDRSHAPSAVPSPSLEPRGALPLAPALIDEPTRPAAKFFQEGWNALSAGRAAAAAELFQRAVDADGRDRLAGEARFWIGVAQARDGQSAAATATLEQFIKNHPASPRAGEATVMLGWLLVDAAAWSRAEHAFLRAEADRADVVRASARKGLQAIAQRRPRGR